MKAARTTRPVAFEVLRNGVRACTAGLRGRPGVLSILLHWANREDGEELMLDAGGLDSATQEHLTWVNRPLRIGDEVVIRVVESESPTRVRSRQKLEKNFGEKQQKAWLRKTAKKYGYKLVRPGGAGQR